MSNTMNGDTILKVRNLNLHFGGSDSLFNKKAKAIRAVDDISLDIYRGETFGIVGESGSGKTTLGRCIMRILNPTSGSIEFTRREQDTVKLHESSPDELRRIWRDIRMVFQDPQSSLNPRLRVIDLVGQALQKSENLQGQELANRVVELLEQVGLRPEYLLRYPGAFSGGQRQRLGIARALATGPELIIADESVSALDVSIQAQILNLMQDLQEKYNLTYLFIAHDLAVVEHICDRVAVMYKGQIVELSTTEDLFDNPKHPYTRALLSAVPIPDPRARDRKKHQITPVAGIQLTTGCRFASRCPIAKDICRTEEPPKRQIGDAEVLCHFAGDK